ncbi:MAG: GWxTD domain-containing protein [Bacteroidales bacterium]|nr:GWxTD domain-containing protein [Bacteroidales bacterium]
MLFRKINFVLFTLLSVIAFGQDVKVIYDFRTYHSDLGNYVEINTSVDASSLKAAKNDKGLWQKSAQLTTVISSYNKADSAIYVDKRQINSPVAETENGITNSSLLDMQRASLPNGEYIVYFELKDVNSSAQPLEYRDAFKINYSEENISLSDIMIAESINKTSSQNIYTRGNRDIIPNVFNSLSVNDNVLTYYVEIYNADKTFGKDSLYALVTNLENISMEKKVENIQNLKRIKSDKISTYVGQLDVSSLIEGTYYLTVEIRNGSNMLYDYKRLAFFKESNIKPDIHNMDVPSNAFVNFIADSSLDETIRCILPIANTSERNFIRKNMNDATTEQKRYFIYDFYRRLNPVSPQTAWKEYMTAIDYVNTHYSTKIKKGYDTDMGRIYLLYGQPDNIIDEKFGASSGFSRGMTTIYSERLTANGSAGEGMGVNYYPYQIWVYNTTPYGESNRKFIFYAKQDNLIEYFLLHSDAKGEVQDMFWENTLSRGFLDPGVEGKAGKQFRVGHE